jgi:phosphohistidine swiveling domain-containing protein
MEFPKFRQLWSCRPYSPFIMDLALNSTVNGFKEVFPESKINIGGAYWKNKQHQYFYEESNFNETIKQISEESINSNWLITFCEKTIDKANILEKFTLSFPDTDFSKISTDDLISKLKHFVNIFLDFYKYGTIQIILGYSDDNLLYKEMDKILERKSCVGREKYNYLNKLTKVHKILSTEKQELEVLKIAKKAKHKNVQSAELVKKLFDNDIKILVRNFCWLSYDLCDSVTYNIDHYAELIYEKLNQDIDLQIENILNYETDIEKEFKKASNELNLSDFEINIFKLMRNLGYYKWLREHKLLFSTYNIKFVQDELSKRFELTTLEFKYLLSEEITSKDFFQSLNKKELRSIIEERMNHFIITYNCESRTFFQGDKAEEEFSKYKFSEDTHLVMSKEISGVTANMGHSVGEVKVINNSDEIGKINSGDVLISVATSPSIITAMKKASAIVTDEGGLTCHAAIVSRELNVPCIVGTKVATKVLKDGDLVEVDANHGMVKILKKSIS